MYYETLYVNILDNLEEMNKFLERYDLQRMNHEEAEKLNISINSEEIESVIKISHQRQIPRPDGSTAKISQNILRSINTSNSQILQKKIGGKISKLILQVQHYLVTKVRKGQ